MAVAVVGHLGVLPCASALGRGACRAIGCPVLTSWATRLLIWMGGGVGTEELFACHARGLALNARLASLRLAEEGGHLVTKLVPKRFHPTPEDRQPRNPGSRPGPPPPLCSCSVFPRKPSSGLASCGGLGCSAGGSGHWAHLSVLRGGRVLLCRRWAPELSVFTLSRSDSGVSMVPAGVSLGKELS